MARIQTYNSDVKVTQNDSWIGTDGDSSNKTKNFTPNKVADYLNSSEKIDKSNTITFTYQTLDFEESRSPGTISFDLSQPPYVSFSSITNILVSKISNGFKTVDVFLSGTNETTIILQRGNSVNEYGLYNVISIDEYLEDDNFFVFTLDFIQGNGGLNEDKEYLFSVVDFSKTIKIHNDLQGLNDGDYIHLTQEEKDTFDYLTDNFPVNTSDLINDGADGTSTYVETEELGAVAFSNDYNDLDNLPTIPEEITKTSDLLNDGSDGVNKFITLEDIPPINISSKLDKDFSTFTDKSTPIDADLIPLYDGANKKLSWSNVKVTLKSYFDTIYQAALGFTPENVANKATNLTSPDNTKYPTTQAVVDGLATKQNTLTNPVTGTGANGQVAFWNGTNSQTGDNGLFWDNTNKRLGVGTASPTSLLELTSATPRLTINDTSGVFGGALAFSNSGVLKWIIGTGQDGVDADSLGIVNGGGASRLHIVNSTGNVGIGTTVPAARLHISGTGLGGSITLTDTAITNASFNSLRLYASTQNRFSIGVGTTTNFPTQITIDGSTSNVGISSTNPQARLDVRAQGALSTDIAFRVRNSADTANLISVNGIGELVCSSVGYFTQGLRTGTVPSRPGFFLNVQNIACNQELNVVGSALIGLNGTINSSSQLQVDSTTKGFLPPRMTNAQRLAIASPAIGLMVYCTDATEGLYINKSTGWQFII